MSLQPTTDLSNAVINVFPGLLKANGHLVSSPAVRVDGSSLRLVSGVLGTFSTTVEAAVERVAEANGIEEPYVEHEELDALQDLGQQEVSTVVGNAHVSARRRDKGRGRLTDY